MELDGVGAVSALAVLEEVLVAAVMIEWKILAFIIIELVHFSDNNKYLVQ